MAVVTIDSYSESNSDSFVRLYNGSGVPRLGQSFSGGNNTTLDSCKFYLKKYGSPTGNITAAIFAHSGTYGTSSVGTGSALATSNNYDIASLTTSLQLITFTFSGANRISLASQYYVVVIQYSGGDKYNYLHIGADGSEPRTHSGNYCQYNTSTGNWLSAGYDIPFYVYGETVAPTVTTQAASSVTYNSATGNGNITATGGVNITRRGFCYKAGTSGDPTTSDSTVYDDGTFGTGAYTKGITGLSAETGYRVRAYAINSVGTSYGSTVQVTTQAANSPVVSTTTTSRLDRKCVIFGGNVTDQGSQAVTERGVYYGTDEFSQTNKLVSSSGLGTYSIFLSGLTPNTKYYFKAFATSSIGTSYGDVLSFTTGNSLSVGDKTAWPPFNKA
jgi:hypothetical protein